MSLFGTLSLWQGVDVPGATCSLVIIDRILSATGRATHSGAPARSGRSRGNGFLAVAATHAALLPPKAPVG